MFTFVFGKEYALDGVAFGLGNGVEGEVEGFVGAPLRDVQEFVHKVGTEELGAKAIAVQPDFGAMRLGDHGDIRDRFSWGTEREGDFVVLEPVPRCHFMREALDESAGLRREALREEDAHSATKAQSP